MTLMAKEPIKNKPAFDEDVEEPCKGDTPA